MPARSAAVTLLLLPLVLALATAPAEAQYRRAEQPPSYRAHFPEEWFSPSTTDAMRQLVGRPAPGLFLEGFINGDPLNTGQLRGQIVVVNFWATWCGPCLASIPRNNEIHRKYADQDVAMLAVCTSRDQEQMPRVAEDRGIAYPTARDPAQRTLAAWRISFFPTYALVDRHGVVRAMGIRSDRVEDAILELLEEQPSPAAMARGLATAMRDRVAAGWLEEERPPTLVEMEGRFAPALEGRRWVNGRDTRNGTQVPAGARLVLVSFFGADDAAEVERLNRLHERFRGEGLVVIGMCSGEDWQQFPRLMREVRPVFAAAQDVRSAAAGRWQIDATPRHVLLHPAGVIVSAGIRGEALEEAIAGLLERPEEAGD